MRTVKGITVVFVVILVSVSTTITPPLASAAEVDLVDKALSLQRKGDCAAALVEFDKALKLDPNDNVALIDRAILRFDSLGDYKGAFEDINLALKINMIDANALRTRADFKAGTGDKKGALTDYREALKWNSKDATAYVNRGILYAQLGEKGLAQADFEKAISLDHGLTAQFNLIRLTSDQKTARAIYEKMLKAKPVDSDDYLALSNVHVFFGYKEKGIAALNTALSKDASYAVAYYNRAVLRNDLGDGKAALADYDKYIELNKSNPKAYFNRSLLRDRLNDREGSMNDLKRALELDPQLQLIESTRKPFGLMMG